MERGTRTSSCVIGGAGIGSLPQPGTEERELAMSVNSAGELVARFYEDFTAGDIGAALSACAEDLEVVDPGMGKVHGRERFNDYLQTFKRAMPDARAIVEQVVESGDAVAVEGRFAGTHTGPLATDDGEVEPTGAAVDLRFADISRVRDRKIVAYHTYYDQLALLTQLGLMNNSA